MPKQTLIVYQNGEPVEWEVDCEYVVPPENENSVVDELRRSLAQMEDRAVEWECTAKLLCVMCLLLIIGITALLHRIPS
jgi:hypothetical protein